MLKASELKMKFRYGKLRPDEQFKCDSCKQLIKGSKTHHVRAFFEDDIRSDWGVHRILCRSCLEKEIPSMLEKYRELTLKMLQWIDDS